MAKITILLADDHAVVREGLVELIRHETDMEVVGEADNGEEAIRLAKQFQPDVILMDIGMPGVNGIEATTKIKESVSQSRILVLTAYDNPEFVAAVVEAGATGYLLKNVRGKELTSAIRSAYEGEFILHPAVARVVLSHIRNPQPNSLHEKQSALSERELQVIKKGAEGLSNKQIATQLNIGARTVQTHWRNIFDKLGVYSRTEAIIHSIRRGWLNLDQKESIH
jgi:DNA-binding NarL/FixJ family response regulator